MNELKSKVLNLQKINHEKSQSLTKLSICKSRSFYIFKDVTDRHINFIWRLFRLRQGNKLNRVSTRSRQAHTSQGSPAIFRSDNKKRKSKPDIKKFMHVSYRKTKQEGKFHLYKIANFDAQFHLNWSEYIFHKSN